MRQRLVELTRERSSLKSVSIPVMRERLPTLARPTHVFERGNFLTKGERVSSATPGFLPPQVPASGGTRLDMSRWLVSPDNPLTARVAVNRFWAQMFGVGLVETQEDFGTSGDPPSHPALLDDLAVRFCTDMDWSVKELLREMALSTTYRQAAEVTAERLQADPQNRLLSRGSRRRLSAEMIRDQALAVSGLLSDRPFGPPLYPPIPEGVWAPFQASDKWSTPAADDPDRYRRAVYTYTKRTIPYPLFAAFDAPSREFCAPRRLPSNTPLQALMTLNDAAFAEASAALAQRMRNAGESLESQLRFGFLVATCRDPRPAEIRELKQLHQTTMEQLADEPEAHDEERGAVSDTNYNEALANVASVLLNLDEVLCR